MPDHHRRSVRLPEFDYSSPGAYFITVVTWQREHILGEIIGGEMVLNEWGFLVTNEWQRLPSRFPTVQLDAFVVIPNHIHGIIWILENENSVGTRREQDSRANNYPVASPLRPKQPLTHGTSRDPTGARLADTSRIDNHDSASPLHRGPPPTGSLGSIVGAFKSVTARLINGLRHTPGLPVWQRNYYVHIITNTDEMQRIRAYIEGNPINWQMDDENTGGI